MGNAHQSITWNPQLSSPFILGGSYLPMIRVIAGNLSITKSEVGQKNTNYSGFEMYPNLKLLFNPITSSADFQFDALQEPAVFELFDALGRSLLRQQLAVGQQTRRVDMQKYPAGIYFARLGGETVRFVSIKN